MSSKALKIFALVSIAFGVLIMLTPNYLAPVCKELLELKSGIMVHMKCFWVGQTAILLGGIVGAVGLMLLFTKNPEILKVLSLVQILIAIALILVTKQFIIGVCIKEMICHKTAFFLNIWGAGLILASTVNLSRIRWSKLSKNARD